MNELYELTASVPASDLAALERARCKGDVFGHGYIEKLVINPPQQFPRSRPETRAIIAQNIAARREHDKRTRRRRARGFGKRAALAAPTNQ